MKSGKTVTAAAVFLFCSFIAAADDEPGSPGLPSIGDFAGKIEVTGNPGSLLSFEIPEDVYRGLERSDMGDIRIYDSSGNPAPFLLRGPKENITVPPEKTVPLLEWNEKAGRFAPSSPDVEISVSGAAISIYPSAGELPAGQAAGAASGGLYLADLSGLDGDPPSKLVLDFEGDAFFNARLSIRKSDDLARWEEYGRAQTAAFYNNPGTDRNEFDIPRARYLLLEFDGTTPPVNSAAVRFDPVETPAALRETSFTGTKSAGGKTVQYRTEGCFPVKQLCFSLARPDSIPVVIRNRNGEEDDWRYAGETVLYRIETPGESPLVNGPVDTFGRGPYWEIEAPGEQVFTEVPRLTILWEALEIVFLARGEGPWTLAYGNGAYGPPESSLSGIRDEAETFPAALGRRSYTAPAGKAAGTERWGQIVLWGILGFAAAALCGLAAYIVKSAKNGE
ncbi:MAG: DUF3999 domain-containing protein [Treponema sp.]|jgi:hypothetical protein|nr:DUF3999 domain-containing protein [Treponema sp.]